MVQSQASCSSTRDHALNNSNTHIIICILTARGTHADAVCESRRVLSFLICASSPHLPFVACWAGGACRGQDTVGPARPGCPEGGGGDEASSGGVMTVDERMHLYCSWMFASGRVVHQAMASINVLSTGTRSPSYFRMAA